VELPKCRHGQTLSRGIPQGVVRCFGCDEPCEQRLECCQCLEIFKSRAVSVAFDTWERAFWQGGGMGGGGGERDLTKKRRSDCWIQLSGLDTLTRTT
jgi:hypothetical protein